MSVRRGRELIQLPGPTNIPERVLRAMHRPAEDFASAEFTRLTRSCLDDLRAVFQTEGTIVPYAALGHGTWEVALANLVQPGDRVLIPGTGRFAQSWGEMAAALGVEALTVPTDLRHPIDPGAVEERLRADRARSIKAVLLVHIETSTGMVHDVAAVRRAMDAADHPALLVVDAVASLGCVDLPMDRLGIDVALAASQKGLMLPPGLSFVAVGPRAAAAGERGGTRRRYWDWRLRSGDESYMWFYGTPPVQMIYGLREALDMLREEGLVQVFARHRRLAAATRASVARWAEAGALEFQVVPPGARSDSVTAIRVAAPRDPDALRLYCRERLNVALGGGLGALKGRVLRIGHMGDLNEPMILGALAALELGLATMGVPHASGGVTAAIAALAADDAAVRRG
jgi:alanine-glyoxylate transaminase/serine-glyoxylate transaminase/serine-pyruvate transaminase